MKRTRKIGKHGMILCVLTIILCAGLVSAAVLQYYVKIERETTIGGIIEWDGVVAEEADFSESYNIQPGENYSENYTIKYVGNLASFDVNFTIQDENGGLTTVVNIIGLNNDDNEYTLLKDITYQVWLNTTAEPMLQSGTYTSTITLQAV